MAQAFHGTLDELKRAITSASLKGEWESDGAGKHSFRPSNGGIINWWESKGTLQVQGKSTVKEKLESILATSLGENAEYLTDTKPMTVGVNAGQIFIVHGHDTEARDQLELTLRRLGLEPFILMNSSGECPLRRRAGREAATGDRRAERSFLDELHDFARQSFAKGPSALRMVAVLTRQAHAWHCIGRGGRGVNSSDVGPAVPVECSVRPAQERSLRHQTLSVWPNAAKRERAGDSAGTAGPTPLRQPSPAAGLAPPDRAPDARMPSSAS
ncbi:MAG: hypothetical protein WED34_11135 [Planctomycetales bacterium]